PAGFNSAQFYFYKKLISIRKNNPVLSTGKFEFLTADGFKLSYKRYDDSSEIFVLFNLEEKEASFSIDRKGSFKDLLTDKVIKSGKVKVEPMSALILKSL
ncbi:MAG TPA: hypothetical protein VMT35_06780, partial [Ignavibacteriaceae bacterium]|nr:hypothetical protein [Ignavibacteriaceae bacterium]